MQRTYQRFSLVVAIGILWAAYACVVVAAEKDAIDFNRDIRTILSNKCFTCHGPDDSQRQSGLRLDLQESAVAECESGAIAVVPGEPDKSELVQRLISDDEFLRMPPADSGKKLSQSEIELLIEWVRQGAPYAQHWSYVKPVRPKVPDPAARLDDTKLPAQADATTLATWPKNEIDHFILNRVLREGLTPSAVADRYAIVRRLSLDLTGLPPTLEEVDQFVDDPDPRAYEKLVDRLLAKETYGEHWARMWLDLARYADSAGYADDPPRTIWAFRDYVIRSLNTNKPFDQFTIEQIAGDLLPNPAQEQLVATAFHRNTLTNNEGGTNDEEFRNVAIVDRVNTTMAVWMGTTINCAQCHTHKYDPISQEEFFRMFAIFNNSQDADRRDESPLVTIWTEEQEQQKKQWEAEIGDLEKTLATATPPLLAEQAGWEKRFVAAPRWQGLQPNKVKLQAGGQANIADDGTVFIPPSQKTNVYTAVGRIGNPSHITGETPAQGEAAELTALRLETLPHDELPGKGPGHAGGNFVITRVLASIIPPEGSRQTGRYVRIEIPGKDKILSLAEVQVFSGADNLAVKSEATQSSTDFEGPARLAIDGNTNGDYNAKSTTHTATEENPWWELDLKSQQAIDRIVIWNRMGGGVHMRLKDFRVAVLDEKRQTVWETTEGTPPEPNREYSLSGVRSVKFTAAYADHAQSGFASTNVIDGKDPNKTGWAIGPEFGKPHELVLVAAPPVEAPPGSNLSVTIEQLSTHEDHTLGHFRLSVTGDAGVTEFAKTPAAILAILKTPAQQRTDIQQTDLTRYYLSIAPGLQPQRTKLTALKKQLAEAKPATTVPVMRELPEGRRRTTRIQRRGNFLEVGDEVTEGLPAVFHDATEGAPLDRLALAQWLIDENNPLTARVIVNRYWEAIFGVGLVRTSEEFGTQGELPSHPELLDWLATELVANDWDLKHLLRRLVTSATYRQSSRVTPELLERDPDNRLLARGPRFRLSAEMVRDQALFASGLLSPKMYGPPVKPPQPAIGLSAAFGGRIDWQTSQGDDRYRRGLYTTWRRSSPYPSMAAFDAPNREVCTVRRDRTNTPLQALVTLNDPVYIEAAQALARRIAETDGAADDKAGHGFRLCVARHPSDVELSRLVALYEKARERFLQNSDLATQMATKPLGPIPEGANVAELAAWTVVGNVLLNLDEMLMKR